MNSDVSTSIMRYGQEISSHPPGIRRPYRASSTGILFETAFEISSTGDREVGFLSLRGRCRARRLCSLM